MAKSNTVTKKVDDYKPSKQLFDRALGAIKIYQTLQKGLALLGVDKEWLAKHGDVGKTIIIPNVGSVQIKNGTAAKDAAKYKTYTFDADKFEALTDARKEKLIEAGVVTINEGITPAVPAGSPTVAFKLNE